MKQALNNNKWWILGYTLTIVASFIIGYQIFSSVQPNTTSLPCTDIIYERGKYVCEIDINTNKVQDVIRLQAISTKDL